MTGGKPDLAAAVPVLPALVATNAAASLWSWLSSSPVPLGAIPLGVLIGLLVYLGSERFRRWAIQGRPAPTPREIEAAQAPPTPPVSSVWGPETVDEGALPVPAVPVGAVAPPPRSRWSEPTVPFKATLWSPLRGTRDLPGDWRPKTVSVAPPPSEAFAAKLVGVFLGLTIVLVVFHRYLFVGIDRLVTVLGAIAYWPLPWPGLILNPTLRRVLPDFVLPVYLALMLAFCLVSGLATEPRYSRRQRRAAALVILGYIGVEMVLDSAAFVFPERVAASAFLLLRGLVGGVFFAVLLFSSLEYPAPIAVPRRLPRDRRTVTVFLGTAALAIVISVALLDAFYHYLGLGRDLVPFAVLLVLPIVGLTIWGLIGRFLYEAQLLARPLPSLEEFHPSVSIIIPAYNEEEDLGATIASADAAAAMYPGATEILVANDGSVDRTLAVAYESIAALKHATGSVLDLPHGGKSNALNGALAVATGDVILRIDADSRISSERGFGTMITHLADPEVGGVQGLILPLRMDGWTGKLRLMEIAWNHLFLRRATMATRSTQVVDGVFCAFRRKDLVDAGGWVSWNGEDTEITLRLQRQGYRMRLEMGAAAFEDVPVDLEGLRKQRIRWNRGGLFAHRRHLGSLYVEAFEFGGPAILLWFTFFARNGLRGLVWAYAALVTLVVGLPTLYHVAVIALILLVPRGVIIGYYMVRFGRWRYLPYVTIWPVTGAIKQFIGLEAFGSMLPGSVPEFAE